MALQKAMTLSKGVSAPECYIKIIAVDYVKLSELDEDLTGPRVILAFYYNKPARDADSRNFIETQEYTCSAWDVETREEMYAKMKTFPEWADAIDV